MDPLDMVFDIRLLGDASTFHAKASPAREAFLICNTLILLF